MYHAKHRQNKRYKISDFVGKWYYSANDETLTLNLESTKNNGIIGKYCNIAYNGNRIDCSPDDEKIIAGVLKKRYSLFKIYRVL